MFWSKNKKIMYTLVNPNFTITRFDVYETLCPQQMLVNKGGQTKNWSVACRDVIPTKLQCQTIQRALESPNLQREIIREKKTNFFLRFSPIDLLIILYQLTKFEAPSCYSFSRYHDYKFSKSKSAKGDYSKKIK